MLCYEECKKLLFYVGPILKVISCLANANVLLCNYAGIQVIILLQIVERLRGKHFA